MICILIEKGWNWWEIYWKMFIECWEIRQNDDQVGQKIKVSEMRKWDKLGCKGDERVGVNLFWSSKMKEIGCLLV